MNRFTLAVAETAITIALIVLVSVSTPAGACGSACECDREIELLERAVLVLVQKIDSLQEDAEARTQAIQELHKRLVELEAKQLAKKYAPPKKKKPICGVPNA